jgi:hypothetical protein
MTKKPMMFACVAIGLAIIAMALSLVVIFNKPSHRPAMLSDISDLFWTSGLYTVVRDGTEIVVQDAEIVSAGAGNAGGTLFNTNFRVRDVEGRTFLVELGARFEGPKILSHWLTINPCPGIYEKQDLEPVVRRMISTLSRAGHFYWVN